MKKVILLVAALLLGFTMQAKSVDVVKAQRLCQQFIQNNSSLAKNAVNQLDLAYIFRTEDGIATAYVFNFDGGFVVVSADDCYRPILGYSDHGNFSYDNAPDGLLFMLGEVTNEIARCMAENIVTTSDIACEWKNLEAFGILHPEKSIPLIGPLVQTRWNQDSPYNMYAPNGYPTGCVATAMAQLMKYWEWPVTGTGEHSYQWNGQTLTANFGETTYDWDNMLNMYGTGTITPENKEAVAILMSHCGISVNMMYAPDGSGAFSPDVPIAISNYFSYSDQAVHIGKSGYAYDEWIDLLKSNLDQQIPLYYSGQGSSGGHAFICDGYDSDERFHFNWGWGGISDGWFVIDGDKFDFPNSQAIIYDFIPDFIYDGMPQIVENLSVTIDSDVSRIGHLSWINPTTTMTGNPLTSLDKVIVRRNNVVVREITGVAPGQVVTCDDEVPYFDQFEYTVLVVAGDNYGRTAKTTAVFGPYCEWTVLMTSSGFQGWDGGGITVQNAAGSYIDFLTTNTASATMQHFQMALGNNNLYWVTPNSNISVISFKVKDAENQIVYQYQGPSSGLEAGLLRTLNNSCGNENTCEAPYHLTASLDPENSENVILSWESDHEPEFGYCIYRDGFLFNMAHETHYVDENTNIGGHCYCVTALCKGGETDKSNEYCITAGTGCDEPTDLYFEYMANNKPQIFWSAPQNTQPTGYVLYRKIDDGNFKECKRLGPNQTSYKDNSVQQSKVYQYAVVAYYQDIDCFSTYANALLNPSQYYITVDWSNIPMDLQAELVGQDEEMHVDLRWRPAFKALNYTVMRNGDTIGEVTETSFTDESLTLGETYCYTVIARGTDYEEPSNEACITMPEAPEPPVMPCSEPTGLKRGEYWASIEWTVPEDRVPDSYTVTVIDHLQNDLTDEITGITETHYDDLTASLDATDRSYKVRAVYEECESEYAMTDDGDDFVRIVKESEPPVLPCSEPTGLKRGGYWASIEWTVPEDRVPDSYTVTVIDHLQNDLTDEITGITETHYDDLTAPVDATDRSYKVRAVYEECESEYAMTDDGDNFVRIVELSVPEDAVTAILYPNPTTGLLTVDTEGSTEVEVFNLVGQCLLRKSVSESNATIDMSGLQNGVYMVKVRAKLGSVMQKVVKM